MCPTLYIQICLLFILGYYTMERRPPLGGHVRKRKKKEIERNNHTPVIFVLIFTALVGTTICGEEVKIRGATFQETNGLHAFKSIGKLNPHSRVMAVKMVINTHTTVKGIKDFEEALGCNFIHPTNISSRLHSEMRCGPEHEGKDGNPALCDPKSDRPCCSEYHYCGNTDAHCTCEKCLDFRTPECDEAAQLRQEVEATSDVFSKEDDRVDRRDWGDFTSSILGVLNFFLGRSTEGKLEHVRKSVDLVMDEVDANRKHGIQTEEAIQNITTFTNRLQERERNLEHRMEVREKWSDIARNAQNILAVLGDAIHHRLNVQVLALVDLKGIWQEMKKVARAKGEVLAFDDWQTLLMLPISFYGKKGEVGILLLVPSILKNARPMVLYKFEASPLYLNGTMFTIDEEEKYLAVDADGGSISYTMEELNRCADVGSTYYCQQSYVRVNGGQVDGYPSCLMNLYKGLFSSARKRCMITARPATEMAWTTGKGDFVISLDRQTTISVKCKEDFYTKTVVLKEGMYKMSLSRNCQAAGGTFSVFSNGQDTDPATILVNVNQSHVTDMTALSEWDEEDALKITYPTPVEDARSKVKEELFAGGLRWQDLVFIVCIAVTGVVVAIVVIVVIFKTKK